MLATVHVSIMRYHRIVPNSNGFILFIIIYSVLQPILLSILQRIEIMEQELTVFIPAKYYSSKYIKRKVILLVIRNKVEHFRWRFKELKQHLSFESRFMFSENIRSPGHQPCDKSHSY